MAKKIVKKNGFGERISVVGKCSTDLDLERGKSVGRWGRSSVLQHPTWLLREKGLYV